MNTNTITSDQVTQLAVGAGAAAAVHFEPSQNAPYPLELTLLNYSAQQLHYRLDGKAATATDRVILANERLVLPRRYPDVSVFNPSGAGVTVEVVFSA